MAEETATTEPDTTEPETTEPDTAEPEIDEKAEHEAEEKAAEIDSKYEPGSRPTVTLPGTGGMVSGTAFADMVDENGELKDDTSSDD
ncbi:hypothetical protein QMK17_19305 [Rhodococcus sp. G-MC3]|uniref:hypothetical protein n=1 Tax=Rhodococcus sp. G-MC3 TaxID=3046209 RepID=UPI0024BAFACD|nr:hypothetical protein [Rhodococcus sp. G-MC3]MDJ0395476.1 hypothetical protein [Rhodococcus sp. G-MC3]